MLGKKSSVFTLYFPALFLLQSVVQLQVVPFCALKC